MRFEAVIITQLSSVRGASSELKVHPGVRIVLREQGCPDIKAGLTVQRAGCSAGK